MGRRAATLASGRRVAELGACASTGDTAGGQCRFLSAAEATHGGGAGHAGTLESTSSEGRNWAKVEVHVFTLVRVSARRHSRSAARKMSTNALIKDWAKGGKEKMCVPACPPRCAGAPSPSPCKVHVLH